MALTLDFNYGPLLLKLFDSGLTGSARNGSGEKDRQREVVVFVLCVINIGAEWVGKKKQNNLTL